MPHPVRYAEDDPYLAKLRDICLAFPQSAEKASHGHPNFYTRKVFAVFGGVAKGDHDSDRYAQSVLVLPDAGERQALLADTDRYFRPAYYGPSGWVGYDFRAGEVDWDEVAELVDTSYRNTALITLVRELDTRGGRGRVVRARVGRTIDRDPWMRGW